jgi:ABC-type phosphate transport system substrate-binding protein
MKLLAIASVAALAVAAGSSAFSAATQQSPSQGPLYGHIKSITRSGDRFVMRFDPAWWLTGLAAERACGCRPVANDYFVVDESHQLLTFAVRRDAHVAVLTRGGPIGITSISVAELAQIIRGKNPKHRLLLGRTAGYGFWIRTGVRYPNPVVSLDQQYQP